MIAVFLGQFGDPQSLKIPLFMERVAAGFPSPAQDYIERTLDLNELCIKCPVAMFFVRTEGEFMVEAGIFSGDILIFDRSLEPVHDDIVIATLPCTDRSEIQWCQVHGHRFDEILRIALSARWSQLSAIPGFQLCGNNSSTARVFWLDRRVGTSIRYA